MHDLLRAYARQLAAGEDGADGQLAAMTSLFDYYLGVAASAMDVLVPAERHYRPRLEPIGTPAPELTTPAQARAWLDAERAVLVAVAAAHRRPRLAGSRHPAGRHPVPLPGDGRPLRRRGDHARPREPGGPPARRPRRRGDGAHQPRHHQLAAGPLPAGGRLPPAVAGRVGRDRRPPGRGHRAGQPRHRPRTTGPLPAGRALPPAGPGRLPEHRRADRRGAGPGQPRFRRRAGGPVRARPSTGISRRWRSSGRPAT